MALALVILGVVLGAQGCYPEHPVEGIENLGKAFPNRRGEDRDEEKFRSLQGYRLVQGSCKLVKILGASAPLGRWKPQFLKSFSLEELRLPSQGLQGSLEDIFAQMPGMLHLDLRNNSLTGSLPASLCSLKSLARLSLSQNQLSGSIECLEDASQLNYLALAQNQFTGRLPGLGKLKMLQTVYLHQNQLSGSLPEFTGLINLRSLWLSENQLSGPVPASIKDLKSLERLSLGSNKLISKLPEELKSLKRLTQLILSNNYFNGLIPDEIFDEMAYLELLDLSDNKLSGIPKSICGASSLLHLDLSENRFDNLPSCFTELKALEAFRASWNQFTRLQWLRQAPTLENLQVVDLSHNELNSVDWKPFLSKNLQSLNVANNVLKEFQASALPELEFISLEHNRLRSVDLCSLGSRKLQVLELGDNWLTGQLPECFSDMSTLRELTLYNNDFSGTVPESYKKLKHLEKFSIYQNVQLAASTSWERNCAPLDGDPCGIWSSWWIVVRFLQLFLVAGLATVLYLAWRYRDRFGRRRASDLFGAVELRATR